jgi:hypothetical protein
MKRLAYFLKLMRVSIAQLHFLQMTDKRAWDNSERYPTESGFLGPAAHSHVILQYQTVDRQGLPLFLFLDLTAFQFEASIAKLGDSDVGRSMVMGIAQEGFWIATEERLQTFADTFAANADVGGDSTLGDRHRAVHMEHLGVSVPAISDSLKDRLILTGGRKTAAIDDAAALTSLMTLTHADVDLRIRSHTSVWPQTRSTIRSGLVPRSRTCKGRAQR